MKILWFSPRFLHPTNTGGQIRTLGILRELHARHEIHYVGFEDPSSPEGLERSREYCTRAYPTRHRAPAKGSIGFLAQAAGSLFWKMPLAIGRFYSPEAAALLARILREQTFDRVVCDFLVPSPHFPNLEGCILFQHNVETAIWQRYEQNAADPFRRLYFRLQARRMQKYEGGVCRRVAHVLAVSERDACTMRDLFGITNISVVPTGVDVDFFACPEAQPRAADLIFAGSMDWPPNVDGVLDFVRNVLPLIRAGHPACSLLIAGRNPPREILALCERDSHIRVTGTVPDIRPHLWGAAVSIVPLRIGGGTRLKIYEAMAAGIPVVASSIGAEGLDVIDGENIAIADSPHEFSRRCLELLHDAEARRRLAEAGTRLVRTRFSWEQAARRFEQILARTGGGSIS